MKTFIFNVKLKDNPKIVREIAVLEDSNLYKLAEAINDAYDFAFDHPFGFFDNMNNPYKSETSYELFSDLVDEGMDIEPVSSGSVKKTKVGQVWKSPGDVMLFLFDYGDDWMFIVKLQGFGEKQDGKQYPRILKKTGRAPRQY